MQTLHDLCESRCAAAARACQLDERNLAGADSVTGHDSTWAEENALDESLVGESLCEFVGEARFSAAAFDTHVPAHLFHDLVRAQAALDDAFVAFVRDPAQMDELTRQHARRQDARRRGVTQIQFAQSSDDDDDSGSDDADTCDE